jgi:hypothetical protein
MRFLLTMNMPARGGSPIHQITCDHPSKSLEEFCDYLSDYEFVIVNEIYRDKRGEPYSVGDIVVNTAFIGKVKVIDGSRHHPDERDDLPH